jgi:hypothetical protein
MEIHKRLGRAFCRKIFKMLKEVKEENEGVANNKSNTPSKKVYPKFEKKGKKVEKKLKSA